MAMVNETPQAVFIDAVQHLTLFIESHNAIVVAKTQWQRALCRWTV